MTTRHLSSPIALGACVALSLAACAGEDAALDTTPVPISDASPTGSSTGDGGGTSSAAPSSTASSTGSGGPSGPSGTDLDAEDQSGDGSSVTVREVRTQAAGFVVVTTGDDDDDTRRVFGSVAVPAGESVDVIVPTSITDSGDYDIVLYLDNDGDGAFDAAVDQPVSEYDDDTSDDDADDDDADNDNADDDDIEYEVR